jgi:hypothetical protein
LPSQPRPGHTERRGGSTLEKAQQSGAGQPTRSTPLVAGQLATITTNWTGPCSSVTIFSNNGWDTNFDALVIQ